MCLLLLAWGVEAWAQGPSIDVENPPGAPEARGKLGPAIGSSGTSGFDVLGISTQPSLVSNRPGPSVSRAPITQLGKPGPPVKPIKLPSPPVLEPANVPRYGALEIPIEGEDLGPPDGLTLDGAIDLLLKWALGVTVTLPVFNRNQGNIARTRLNADQSTYELANQERQVVYDVEEAIREFDTSLKSMLEMKTEIIPASRKVRDSAYRRWQGGGETSALECLDAQAEHARPEYGRWHPRPSLNP
jgi:hypothetical protein